MSRDWRKNIHPELREHLEKEIRNTFGYRKAYEDADNKGNAQLWVAIGNLSKMITKLDKKLGEIEKGVREAEKGLKQTPEEEVSFVETPLMGMDTTYLKELDEVRELVEAPVPGEGEISEKEVKREKKRAGVKKAKSGAKKAVKNKVVNKNKKLSKSKKIKKAMKRF